MPSVLFVCTANMCRSPMAEALLKHLLGPEAQDWRIESAGTWTQEGQPAARRSVQTLEARGLDLSAHRSRPVTRELLQEFSLILVMEAGHKEALTVEFPSQAGKIFLLSEMSDRRAFDIADPMGGSKLDFEATVEELEGLLAAGLGRIRELAGG